jgi:site-specific recombinase XerD
MSVLPKSIRPEEVEAILATASRRRSPVGLRDFAILLLLARLGFRAGEIVALELEDIDWAAGEIAVRGKGSNVNRLPLPQEVGRALVAYLQKDRPRCVTRRVFIRGKAPHVGLANSVTVSSLVARAIKRAGFQPPRTGAHVFRHTLASQLLSRGASLREIGKVLRHRHPDTTAIYAKVDVETLRSVAQPWPGRIV